MDEKSESLIPNSKFLIKFIANDTTSVSYATIPFQVQVRGFLHQYIILFYGSCSWLCRPFRNSRLPV